METMNRQDTKGIEALSVLIPCYNSDATTLVRQLLPLLRREQIDYEVIVADDGSTDQKLLEANASITRWEGCRHLPLKENAGRAAVRNLLAREARYPYLLYIDSHMSVVNKHLIRRYLQCGCDGVTDGGVIIGGDASKLTGNLRYRYEKAEEAKHSAPMRQRQPYQHLHTANLLVRRDVLMEHPFDERFRRYGYEDVLLGKSLHQDHIPILHIDNPMGFCTFEANDVFIAKTEEGLRTLHEFRSDLRGYSRLLTLTEGIHLKAVRGVVILWHRLMGPTERRNLCGNHPNLVFFKLYRLGYFLSLE